MDEGDDAVGEFVIGGGDMAVDREFETVERRIVGNRVVHGIQSSGTFPAKIEPGSFGLAALRDFLRPVADCKIVLNGACRRQRFP
jgi:hypothetical protein